MQAAPRQRDKAARTDEDERDAPCAGSAEAKSRALSGTCPTWDAPCAGSAEAKLNSLPLCLDELDAPCAGSAEAKTSYEQAHADKYGDAPCAGSAEAKVSRRR